MGFLQIDAVDNEFNLQKATIAFWFRVPEGVFDTVDDHGDFQGDPAPPLDGTVPLVVFGDPSMTGFQTNSRTTAQQDFVREYWTFYNDTPSGALYPEHLYQFYTTPAENAGGSAVSSEFYDTGVVVDKGPSYIGIVTNKKALHDDPDADLLPNCLRIRIQMPNAASGSGLAWGQDAEASGDMIVYDGFWSFPDIPNIEWRDSGPPNDLFNPDLPPPGAVFSEADENGDITSIVGGKAWTISVDYIDQSDVLLEGVTEYFDLVIKKTVTPNKWHHVIVSFDVSGEVHATGRTYAGPFEEGPFIETGTITSTCKIFVSYDDVNKSGDSFDYGIDFDYVDPIGANDFVTVTSVTTAESTIPGKNGTHTATGVSFPPPGIPGMFITSTVSGASQPLYDFTPDPVAFIGKPIGVPCTAAYSDRVVQIEMARFQMFQGVCVDTSDVDIRRMFVTSAGKPADMALSRAYLGVPIVEFDKQDDFIAGRNTGTLGNFTPTGTVIKYDIDPGLG